MATEGIQASNEAEKEIYSIHNVAQLRFSKQTGTVEVCFVMRQCKK